jgi:uncharacterized membrane protein
VVDAHPVPKKDDGKRIIQQIEAHWCGPLPPPAILKGYQQIDPTFPERIVRLAETEADHRRTLEDKVITAEIASTRRGQHATVILCLGLFGLAGYAAHLGQDIAASLFGIAAVVSPMISALLGQHIRKKAEEPKQAEEPKKDGHPEESKQTKDSEAPREN